MTNRNPLSDDNTEPRSRGKVFIINPPVRGNENTQPLDLMYLAAIAEDCGFETKIKDYGLGGDFLKDLTDFRPHYLIANISTQTFLADMDMIKRAKSLLPELKTIVKGVPFLTYNTNAIYENAFLDYVIMGEAEFTLRDILNGVPDDEILGICYRDNFQAVKNESRPLIENLDLIPFPARHLIDNSRFVNPFNKKNQAMINISRGCPCYCFFCLVTPFCGEKVRVRSAESIISEVKECIEKYGIKDFIFKADNFCRDWMIDLCKKIIDYKLKITWMTKICASPIDEELVNFMYKAGCRYLSVGIESGSQKILDKIEKNISLDEIRKAQKILKKSKIKIHNCFTLGLPWETEETVEESIKFAIELDSNYVSFLIATPFPGTKFFNYIMLNHLSDGTLDFKNAYKEPIVRSHELRKERILELQKHALNRFYFRPKFLIRHFLSKK